MFQILKTFVVLAGAVAALPTNEQPAPSQSFCNVQSATHCCYTKNHQNEEGLIPIITNLGSCYPVQVPVIGGAVQNGPCNGGKAACCGPQSGVVNAGCALPGLN